MWQVGGAGQYTRMWLVRSRAGTARNAGGERGDGTTETNGLKLSSSRTAALLTTRVLPHLGLSEDL